MLPGSEASNGGIEAHAVDLNDGKDNQGTHDDILQGHCPRRAVMEEKRFHCTIQ